MPTWLIIILIAAAICGVIGYFFGEEGRRGENAASGAMAGAMGCGYILLQLFLWGLGIAVCLWLFSAIFG